MTRKWYLHPLILKIEHVYVPEKIFSNLQLNFDGLINLTLQNIELCKGSKIILKPHTSNS